MLVAAIGSCGWLTEEIIFLGTISSEAVIDFFGTDSS